MTSHTMVVATTICLLTLVISLATSKPVSLLILRNSPPPVYFLHLNFYNDTFHQFYHCMTQTTSSKCLLNFKYDQQHPYNNDDIYVDTIIEQGVIVPSDLDFFSCINDPQTNQVICERHTSNSNDRNGYQSFRLCGLSSAPQCARLFPSVPGEKLLYNSTTDHIQECSTPCTQTTTSTTSLTSRLVTVLSSVPTEASTASDDVNSTNDSTDKTDKQTDNNNNLPVIVGTVCGALIVVIVIVIGIFLWRRHRLNKCREDQDHVVKSVGSHGNDRNGYRNKQSDKTSSNLSKTPGSTSSLSCTESRGRQTTDSADGNYILKHDCSGFTYYNTLDSSSQHVNDVTSTKVQTTPDDDYENTGDRDYRNIDTVVAGADDGYTMIDDYHLAQTTDTTSQQ